MQPLVLTESAEEVDIEVERKMKTELGTKA
jgi:hypothetical protein